MHDNEAYELIKEGDFNKWKSFLNKKRNDNKEYRPSLEKCSLRGVNLDEFDFTNVAFNYVDFTGAQLKNTIFKNVEINNSNFEASTISSSRFYKVQIKDSQLIHADLSGTKFENVTIENTDFSKANLKDFKLKISEKIHDVKFENIIDATKCTFYKSTMTKTKFNNSKLIRVNFDSSTLINCNFTNTDLSHSTVTNTTIIRTRMTGVKFWQLFIDKRSHLQNIFFDESNHINSMDYSDTIKLSKFDKINWETLRFMSEIPLFGISWASFSYTILLINTIIYLNNYEFFLNVIRYPIPIPERAYCLLLSSFLLIVGSTIYSFKCPKRVKEFTETSFVEKYGHPRLQYIGSKLELRILKNISAFFTIAGAFIALLLIIERLIIFILYLIKHA